MNDRLEEIEKYSPYGGDLILEEVKGTDNVFITAENSVTTSQGCDRTMYSYIPKNGCPDAKQCQVLMVLRNEATKESAEKLMHELKLDTLAEERHFILLFPNPTEKGWNYMEDKEAENDLAFLVRCFAVLPKSKGGVAGFNGMIFYIGTTPESSALLQRQSLRNPLDTSAIMVGKFPENFSLSEKAHPQTAWIYDNNTKYGDYLKKTNNPVDSLDHHNPDNPNIRYFLSERKLDAGEVAEAWELMFSEARRWRNDTYGTYQKRTNFDERGFVAHVKDSSLGVNDGFEHTWYEYIPEKLRKSNDPVPLVFYFHGGNCIPLYGAEQSGWHDIADRENFIVVYPRASANKTWNVWDDEKGPSDFKFILALIDHMKKVHPIDESRIYVSGFSMGSMMTNALCCCYPEIFAGGAAFNAQHIGYFALRDGIHDLLYSEKNENRKSFAKSRTHEIADSKKSKYDYRVALLQGAGLLDSLGGTTWPIKDKDDLWIQTINYWKEYNNIPLTEFKSNDQFETGLFGDENTYVGTDERFILHKWYTRDSKLPLYQFMGVKRMPHAVDLREMEIAWNFLKQYSRMKDGSLSFHGNSDDNRQY